MVKFKTRRKPQELILGVIALGSALFMFHSRFYKSESKAIQEGAGKIASLKNEITKDQSLIAELKQRVGDMNKKVEQAQNEKPTKYLSELINEINSKENGIKVSSYTTRETPVENSIYSVSVDLDVESSFLDLATMMERLEEKYHYLEFKQVSADKVNEFVQKVTAKVSLSIYLDKERN